ncbi:MAG: AAA family ATPase [bacterium]|nr:AAA family ATPase [bacterium]
MYNTGNGEKMSTQHIKQIPYGISDYELIRMENYYYVDKTAYLELIKKAGRYLFFIRPRRFGKSLLLAMMEAYYDVYYKERFEEFFKGTAIYDNPTGDRGAYLVLKFNFSLVNPSPDKVEDSFLEYVRMVAQSFIRKYGEFLLTDRKNYIDTINKTGTASDILSHLSRLCRESHQKMYVFIDEYDNFANTILSTAGAAAYEDLTHGAGSYRAFFNVLKGGTDGTGAPFARLFLTGVSPVTLDDVTSGYNIGKNVSLEPSLNRMLGFTEKDVIDMIEYYREKGCVKHSTPYLMDIITQWYGNYQFSEDGDDIKMFNSDMILYFIDHYISKNKIPSDLIDRNVRIDYGKLRHLIIVDRKNTKPFTNGNFSKLKQIIEEGGTSSEVVKGFPLEQVTDAKNFKSLLFYLGLLTVKGPEKDKLRLEIPNETVRRLFYDYIEGAYRETDTFDLDLSKYADLMTDMAYDGKWKPLFKFITRRMRESMSLRDLITGEKSIQAFLNVYLGLSHLYIIHTEKEMNKGYADIFMEPFLARYEGIRYSYLLEIKYLKSDAGTRTEKDEIKSRKKDTTSTKTSNTKLQNIVIAAEEQLKDYTIDEKTQKTIEKTKLIKLVLIFAGHDAIYIDEMKEVK